MINFRDLTAADVECRVAQCTEKGASILLYKNARVDMAVLDEAVGAMNWQRSHTRDNANCIVSIWDAEKNQWISKEDTGTESNTEKEKGLASDSFKRACFNWGIGRELYTAPFIWIPAADAEVYDTGRKNQYGKPQYACKGRFEVSMMKVENKTITALEIKKGGKVVFTFGNQQEVCAECGMEIKPVKKRDGSIWQAADIAGYSKMKFGQVMCNACMRKAVKV